MSHYISSLILLSELFILYFFQVEKPFNNFSIHNRKFYCSVLFCSVLFCSVPSVLFCSVLFCSVLFCSVLLSLALSLRMEHLLEARIQNDLCSTSLHPSFGYFTTSFNSVYIFKCYDWLIHCKILPNRLNILNFIFPLNSTKLS